MAVNYKFLLLARGFVLGKLFQPSLKFVGKAGCAPDLLYKVFKSVE